MTTFVAVPGPGVAGPVPVQLDAVAFGIVEVEGLADEVVGAAREGLRLELRRAGDGGGQGGWSSKSRAVWKRPASPREGRFSPGAGARWTSGFCRRPR